MKKFFALMLCATFTLSAAGCGGGSDAGSEEAVEKYGSDTLKVFNWGEYIGEDVISNFEDEYGVTVIYEMFDSNEMMYTKLQAGDKYDVLVPSDYMIERLKGEGMLQELDKSLIPNLENLTNDVIGLDFDPDQTYSVPYFYGTVGIVYNKNNVPLELLEEQGWNILKNTDYKGSVYIYDSERDSFMMALKALGYSMNTEDESEIQAAYDWLLELNNTMEPAYVTDEVIDAMAGGVKDLAVVYSGDAAYILSENEDMGYFTPNEGTNLWCDAMVIPANSENPLLDHEFINYVLTYDASYDNSYTVGYTSSNDEVKTDLSAEDGEFGGNEAYVPRSGYEYDEVFHDNKTLREKLSSLWIKVKSTNS
ncbi:MAG: ABC transporter substrate-binding protein [Clostridiales bacterium]|nr:ABC transporter substrate-binding protein [Clostridiales bacterium]